MTSFPAIPVPSKLLERLQRASLKTAALVQVIELYLDNRIDLEIRATDALSLDESVVDLSSIFRNHQEVILPLG